MQAEEVVDVINVKFQLISSENTPPILIQSCIKYAVLRGITAGAGDTDGGQEEHRPRNLPAPAAGGWCVLSWPGAASAGWAIRSNMLVIGPAYQH